MGSKLIVWLMRLLNHACIETKTVKIDVIGKRCIPAIYVALLYRCRRRNERY